MDLTGMKVRFDSAEFERLYHYDGPLGSFSDGEGSRFFLWAPTAQSVTLRLYREGSALPAYKTHRMNNIGSGVWCWETRETLAGNYYDYEVTVGDLVNVTPDPYAKAAGVNGRRSMVIDLKTTDPAGWAEDKAPAKGTESIIYELHVKDFSWDPASGVRPDWRGKYKAFTQTGTTLAGGQSPTCLDYLKELGVTHIQLMPVYDYGSVDETTPDEGYNWGYDPVNYNVPEGSYSTDPSRGEVRVRELKEAIQALHKAGFRVIMDVVYNHTYDLGSPLFKTVPWYYYRQEEGGKASNGSGCGNEIATERSMCSRYIIDSCLHWLEEYHMDGFRFDLMGIMDVELMNRIQAVCDSRWGKGEKLIYGEPWSGGACHPREGTKLADKGALPQLTGSIGAFCDSTRDAIKGSVMDEHGRGMVNGGGLKAKTLENCVKGWAVPGSPFPAQTPAQTISYLSCHDDWTLWDKLIYTLDEHELRFDEPVAEVLQANKLAAALCFCCQGRPFIHAGEEFGRTKGGVKNSFKSPAQLNRLDWQRSITFKELKRYYQGLIGLRKQLPSLCDKTTKSGQRVLISAQLEEDLVYLLLENGGESRWDRLILLFNASKKTHVRKCLPGKWEVLVDGSSSQLWKTPKLTSARLEMPPMSALILGRVEAPQRI